MAKKNKAIDKIGSETLKRMDSVPFYNDVIFRRFSDFIGGEILEIGCGIGNFTKMLLGLGNVWSLDIDKYYVAKTRKRTEGVAHVGVGNIESNTYFFDSKKKFDSIVCLNVLEHIANDEDAVCNMYKLLKKNGVVFFAHSCTPIFLWNFR